MPDTQPPVATYKTKQVPSNPLRTSLAPGVQNQRLEEINVPFPKDNELAAAVVNPGGGDSRVYIQGEDGQWHLNPNR